MSLELIIGSMYSGKTTELMRRVNRLTSIGMKCIVITHDLCQLQNHDGYQMEAIKTSELLLVGTEKYNVIAIDEGQFFNNLRVAVTNMVKHNKYVIVAGLNGDYKQQKFGEILDLVPFADDVVFKRALCANCRHPGRYASFTKRIDNSTEVVSPDSTYTAVCRHCYLE